ncbi:MAG TPA: response regulator [Myxococcales bacterium]|nr:response regulator [Myxococcales bacterium]
MLLVDDARVVLRVVERALTSAGYDLSVAETAERAVRLLEEQEFACALIDRNLNLAESDGLDLIKQIRERQPRCACVLMTAYPSVGSAVEALRMGVVDYIQKPSPDFDVIAERVESAVRLHRGREGGHAPRSGGRPAEEKRNQVLVRGADELVATLRALQSKTKPAARAAVNRALANAEAQAALLRGS